MNSFARHILAAALLGTSLTAAAPAKPTSGAISPAAGHPAPPTQPVAVHPDFTGVWVMAEYDLVVLPQSGNPPYTAEVQANMDRYKREFDAVKDDPAQFCVRMGMPYRMLNRARDYPVDIYQTKDRVVMLFEGHDDYRSVRLDRTTVPENLPASANGWSNAHWEGDTLVITTSNVTGRSAINPLQRSEEAVITERWTMQKHPVHGDLIDIDITIVDPLVYTLPVKAHNAWKRAAPGVEVGGYNCADALWETYLEAREAEIAAKMTKGK